MIVIGGRGVDQPDPNILSTMLPGACDPNGIVNIFDVNTLKWDPNFKVSKLDNFKVNEKITGGVGIGGGPTGGATKVDPEGGWTNAELKKRFKSVYNVTATSGPKSGSTGPLAAPSSTGTSKTGAASGPATAQGKLFSLCLLVMAVIMAS